MSDILKRVIIGAGIGLAVGLIISWGSNKIPSLKSLLDGYEYLSYDARMKYKVADVELGSTIEDIVIIDIGNASIASTESDGLGRFKDWPQAYHGQLIDVVTNSVKLAWTPDTVSSAIDYYHMYRNKSDDSEGGLDPLDDIAYDSTFTISGRKNWVGYDFFVQHVNTNGSVGQLYPIDTLMLIESRSLLFDIIFDPQDTTKWHLVNDLAVTNSPADSALAARTNTYLLETDPTKFVRATRESEKTHHALVLEKQESSTFSSLDSMKTEHWGTIPHPGSDISLNCLKSRPDSCLPAPESGIHIYSYCRRPMA